MERQTLSNCLPLFRLGSGHKEVESEDYNLSRQHLDNNRVQGRVIDTKRCSPFSSPELKLCHQLQEVCVRPLPCVGISGIGNRFSEFEDGTSQGESRKDRETMPISNLVRKSISEELSKVNGETLLYGNGSSTSTSAIQEPLTTLNYRSLYEEVIRRHNCVTKEEAKLELDS